MFVHCNTNLINLGETAVSSLLFCIVSYFLPCHCPVLPFSPPIPLRYMDGETAEVLHFYLDSGAIFQ